MEKESNFVLQQEITFDILKSRTPF